MEERNKLLSKRLLAIAQMVTPGNIVADVGCDHGFVSIYLVQQKRAPHCIAMDVRKGPLEGAAKHVKEAGLTDKIETRLSDGMDRLDAGEAQTLIIAGMGGPLMLELLFRNPEKTASFSELILQPQSELGAFRHTMRQRGYRLVEETILLEDGKYYFPMRYVKGDAPLQVDDAITIEDDYGPLLLQKKNPVFGQYLKRERELALKVKEQLLANPMERSMARLQEIEIQLERIQIAENWEEQS